MGNNVKKTIAAACLGFAVGTADVQAQEISSFRDIHLGAHIAGQLVLPLEDESGKARRIGAPEGEVRLTDVQSGREVAVVRTTLDGQYRFEALSPGTYEVCWEWQGQAKGCEKPIKINRASRSLGIREISSTALKADALVLPDSIADLLEGFLGNPLFNSCNNPAGEPRYLVKRRNYFPAAGEPAADVEARERTIAEAYYEKIDSSGSRDTLGDWWTKNGFDPVTGRAPAENNGFDAAAIAYLNHNDLGFGRNMHCLKRGASHVSCWVANHGAADQSPTNADLAAANVDPGATVTMEFSALDTRLEVADLNFLDRFNGALTDFGKRVTFDTGSFTDFVQGLPTVKFYVYKPDPAGQPHAEFTRATSADLDGCGEKFVPGLCLNCHGGRVPFDFTSDPAKTSWSTADVLAVGEASFREFDTESFRYPGNRQGTNNVEDAVMKRLNKLVQATDPVAAIDDLVDAWYSGSGDITLDANYVPGSWQTTGSDGSDGETVYRDTVAKGCRTCHVALESYLDWNDRSSLASYVGSLPFYLCDEQSMPHAEITDLNFTDAQRDQLLAHFGTACN